MHYENDHNYIKYIFNDFRADAKESFYTCKSNNNNYGNCDSFCFHRIIKSNVLSAKGSSSLITLNFRGTGNILVAVDSNRVKSTSIIQLTTENPTTINIPSSLQAGKTSITYLSS